MTVKEFIDRMNQLPEEVKALQIGFFDFGHNLDDPEWLDEYLECGYWKNWNGEEDNNFTIC